MFSGLIEALGTVAAIQGDLSGSAVSIDAAMLAADLTPGDSINVDGVCLTVTMADHRAFSITLAPETLRRTTLGLLQVGSRVNLERALRVGDRMGGHYVQGHVDGTARIVQRRPDGNSLVFWLQPPAALTSYIVEKGFVAIDAISLTVTEKTSTRFAIMIIPYTSEHVALSDKAEGDMINIEVDVIAKYVEALMTHGPASVEVPA